MLVRLLPRALLRTRRTRATASAWRALSCRAVLTLGLGMLLLSTGACRNRATGPAPVSDSTFVATMADLYEVNGDRSLDSSARAAARQRVLTAHGVSSERLEATGRALGTDPERAARVWARLDSLVRGTLARPAAARDPSNNGDSAPLK
jgi:hypothetical protein